MMDGLFSLEMHLRVAGVLLLLLGGLNVLLPRRFGWMGELQKVSLLTRQVFVAHCVFLILMLVMMGVLSLFYAGLLVNGTPLATVILAGMSLFWGLRLVMQFVFYSPKLWRGHRFNTVMHVMFSFLWAYFSVVYTASFVHSLG